MPLMCGNVMPEQARHDGKSEASATPTRNLGTQRVYPRGHSLTAELGKDLTRRRMGTETALKNA